MIGLIMGSRPVQYLLMGLAFVGAVLGALKLYGNSVRREALAEVEAAGAKKSLQTAKEIGNAVEASRASGGTWHDRLRAHTGQR